MPKNLKKIFLQTCLLLAVVFPSYSQAPDLALPDSLLSLSGRAQAKAMASFTWLNREKNTDLAIAVAEKGIEISEANGYKEELAKLYNYLGVIYQHYKKQTSHAIPYYNKGLQLSLQVKDSVEIGYVYNNLGDAFYQIGNIPLARQYAEKTKQVFQELEHPRGIAYSYINMGLVSHISQEYDTALHYFRKAIELRKTFNDSVGIASATLEVARTLEEMHRHEDAMKHFRESYRMHVELENKNYIAYSLIGMGEQFLHVFKTDSALLSFNSALKYMLNRNNHSGIVASQLGIAKAYSQKGLREMAEEYFDEALLSAQNTGNTRDILNVYSERADFYHNYNQNEKAYRNYKSYVRIFDSLYTELQYQTLSEVENRFRITEELSKINEDLMLKRQQQVFGIILIGLLILLSAALVMRYRIKSRLTKKLEESIRLKNKIFSIISHDLISPFNVLIGYSQLIQRELQNKEYEKAGEYANIILKSANESSKLTNNLLNWARAQRDKIEVKPIDFKVVELLKEVRNSLQTQASSKNISIDLSVDYDGNAYADRNLIRTVIQNLLSNAIKFTHRDGKIVMKSEKKNRLVEISIADSGIGIPESTLPKIFREIESVNTVGTEHEKGTGLGLLVCKEFVELNNGEIRVSSTTGKGSVFTFTLPLSN